MNTATIATIMDDSAMTKSTRIFRVRKDKFAELANPITQESKMVTKTASIENRLAQLEQKDRHFRMLWVMAPLLAFGLGAAANDVLKAKSVTTEKLIIVDDAGKVRAALYANAKGDPNLELYNLDGSLLLNLARSDDNGIGCIQFFSKEGQFKGGAGGNALK